MNYLISISQLSNNYSHYLLLPPAPPQNSKLFRQKPQIATISGVSPKKRNRYRVVLGDEVLGAQLTIEQAIALANQSTHY